MAGSWLSNKRLIIAIGILLFVAVVLAIVIPLTIPDSNDSGSGDTPKAEEQTLWVDCYPDAEGRAVNEKDCTVRGCTFEKNPKAGQPSCYYGMGQYGLQVDSFTPTQSGFRATLKQMGKAPFGGDISEWVFTFENRGNDVAHFMFDTVDGNRYKVPKEMNLSPTIGQTPKYEIKTLPGQNFAFQIIRKETGVAVWDIDVGPGGLILSDQFLQITTRLPSTNVFGLGEHVHDSFNHDVSKKQIWPSFARDQPPSYTHGANLYGTHPFYTCVEDAKGNTHGVLMLNSDAQEYAFSDLPSLTFRTIGGILDFYVFMGPTPEQVVQQYTGVIGRPLMPPYWSLGFQQCRYGYNNISNLKEAVETTANYDIPHDVQYVDIDHMDKQKIFTVDQQNFPNLNEYFKSLQAEGMRIIYILDPCLISTEPNYKPYVEMKKIGGNIKWASDVTPPPDSSDTDGALLGYVWPEGKTVFPDYMKQSVKNVWQKLIVDYRHNLTFDGIWIDMNEPASFDTNLDKPWNWPENKEPWGLKCPEHNHEDPPYRPKAVYLWDQNGRMTSRLSDKTICMSTVQGDSNQYSHYDVHNLYGWSQSDATFRAVQEATGERSIVISRSTFPGSGKYVGHWLGDNVSQWKDLHSSIIGLLEFNLFGIPYIGADICGFFENTTPQLCKRWMQLGAFYTFSRNHNGKDSVDQGPGQLGDDVGYASRDILRIRYRLLPYLYLLFHHAHTQGSTVIRPLHHEFPTDRNAMSVDTQFMWGSCLLISPILEENQRELNYYVPQGKWYNYYTHMGETLTMGKMMNMLVDDDTMPLLHVRGGCVLVEQDYANNTHYSRQKPLTIIAALDADGKASGSFFWDDGVSIDTYKWKKYYMASLMVEYNKLTLRVDNKLQAAQDWDKLIFQKAVIMGVMWEVSSVKLGSGEMLSFNQTGEMLEVDLPDLPMRDDFTMYWSSDKIDCYPEAEGKSVTLEDCISRKCNYTASPPAGQPYCYFTKDQYNLQVEKVETTAEGFTANLKQMGDAPFGGDVREWVFLFENRGDNVVHFKMTAATGANRYEVPTTLNLQGSSMTPNYELKITNNESFAFQIIRKATGTVIWDIDVGPGGLILSDQFLQITTRLPSTNVFGLGEHVHDSFKHDVSKKETWPSFARDQPPSFTHAANLYGTHPFYTCVEDEEGNTHGVFMLNSNAQEYAFSDAPSLTFRTIGGILDFYVFMGPTPEQVVQQYTEVIGRPLMPPYWALGFQQCRYGYNNIDNLKEAVESTARYDIPHDVQYVDIDHMEKQKIFTVDRQNFPNLNEYFLSLQAQGMRIIYILDPCLISTEPDYQPYVAMKNIPGNIKWALDVSPPPNSSDTDGALLGYVWPEGKTVFPDYMKSKVKEVWKNLIVAYRHNLTFDGIWIDMNEPASFDTNKEKPWNWPEGKEPWGLICPNNSREDPPYRPKAVYLWDEGGSKISRLSDKTICMSTVQGDTDQYSHYDVHNLYGWSQSDATFDATREATGERSIVISRSTFPGSGKYVGHWLGDNVSQWKDLHSSIIGLLEFNLFGIPYVGADICGFFGDTTPQLCKRWMQLGAFYTFSRNHNGKDSVVQGPGQLGDDVGYASRDILRIRYRLLPYLYLLFHHAHTQGSTVIRPLHHEFPRDRQAMSVDTQFLWGSCLLISPILEENQSELNYYLPQGKWYNYYTHMGEMLTMGEMKKMPVDDDTMPLLHLRGGCVLVEQDYANNTHYSRQNPFTIIAALDNSGRATGHLFWDDGVSTDTYQNDTYYMADFKVENNMLDMNVTNMNPTQQSWDNLYFDEVIILGVNMMVSSVKRDDDMNILFTQTGEVLKITQLDQHMRDSFKLAWS